jgi:plasmid stabilization system protein ParE
MGSPNERDETERSYHVELKETAEAEAEAAYLWMSQRSPEYAIRWYKGLLEAIAGLSFMPRRFPVAPESEAVELHVGGKPRPIRHLRYGRGPNTWRVLF